MTNATLSRNNILTACVSFRVFQELKEKHALAEAIKLQKTLQDSSIISQKQEGNTISLDSSSKSEEEIIVDGDPTTKQVEPDTNAQTNTSGVVVIDDDVKQTEEKEKPVVQLENNVQNKQVQPQEPVVTEIKLKTLLEELMSLLHDKNSLTKEELSQLYITMDDFRKALKCVQPSAKREGFATVPDVTWDDIGSLQDIREELKISILVS